MVAKWARKDYGSYGVPWPGSGNGRWFCNYLRHPKTTQERRKFDKKYGRRKRCPSRLPDTYDDMPRSDIEDRSWKRHRKTQYKIVYK
jgi:hypothetical protein